MSTALKLAATLVAVSALLAVFLLGKRVHHSGGGGIDKGAQTILNMTQLAAACREYRRLTGAWPTQYSQIRSLVPATPPWIFRDGWGREIRLLAHTNAPNTIWLESYGATGVRGGTGSNAPITTRLD
jgi:hypothetical protein